MRNFGTLQLVLVGRQLLHAVVPVGQALQPLALHGVEQRLALGALLEAVHRLDVVEQERQVEHLQLLGVAVELRQRRRDELHVAEQHCLQFLGVAEQLRVREHLHLHLAGELLLGEFLELECRLPLGRAVGDDVAELDDQRGGLRQGR
jgi:hypothetical protein